jgi:hypothetical protein
MKPNSAPKALRREHAHTRAHARGYEAATTGARNRYTRGSYCWISFERGKRAALLGPATKPTPSS